jgi:hypothetical protein
MRLHRGRGLGVIAAAHVAAVLVGTLIAFTSTSVAGAERVAAANHCTNYHPQSYTADVNCDLRSTIAGSTWGQTCCTGLRDSNRVEVDFNRTLEVWYGENQPVTGFGTYLNQGSSGGYFVAGCYVGGPAVNGRCRTNWHDYHPPASWAGGRR